jgi:hypothetical protein
VPSVLVLWGLFLAFGPGTDRWPWSGWNSDAEQEWQRSRNLEEQRAEILRRVHTKYYLAGDVAEGRLGLLEAAALFRDLDRQWPALEPDPRHAHLGITEEERYCRAVIGLVRLTLHDRAEGGAAVVERLEAELRSHLERGNLRLPAHPPADSGSGNSAPKQGGK